MSDYKKVNFDDIFKTELPKYKFNIPTPPQPFKIETSELVNLKMPKPLKYENSIFKQQADDIKLPLERQINSIEHIAKSAEVHANSSLEEIRILKEQLELAKAESKGAQRDSVFSKIVSIISILIAIGSLVIAIIAIL